MSDVQKINVQDTVSFFLCLSVCLFCFSTGVADIKAWLWSDPEPPVTSRSRERIKVMIVNRSEDESNAV